MEADTINQAYIFIVFIINGLLIGLIFDVFRILRKSFKTSDLMTYIEDIVFWILVGMLLLYSIFVFNNGNVRLYIFVALLFGILIYMFLISKIIINVSVKIIKTVKEVTHKVINVICYPLKLICKVIRKVFLRPIAFVFINLRDFSSKKIYLCYKKAKNISIFRKKEGKQPEM